MAADHENGLLRCAANGESEAFQRLFETHHAAVYRFAYRLTGAVDVAEDTTQECFLRLMRSPGFDHQRGSLRQYLYGMVRNLVRQRWQASGREVQWDDQAEDNSVSAIAVPLDPIVSAEISGVVQVAISALPPLQREAIVLFEFEDLSLEEIATVVGADVGTVKSRLHRARESLRLRLAPYRNHIQMPPKGATYEPAK